MTGLQREIRSRILGATAHISVFKSRNDTFDNYREVVNAVRKAAPRAAIAFNTRPEDSADAAARCLRM